MIRLRMDVDYAYPSRAQSLLFTTLNVKTSPNYLKNAKIIAKIVNSSPLDVKVYWFFTPQTTPDQEMQDLLNSDRHEVGLHVVNKPKIELEQLQEVTKQQIRYFTNHGTERLIGRLIWRRKIWETKAKIPEGFPLKDLWDLPTLILDRVCYVTPTAQAVKIAEKAIVDGKILHAHPDWLFQRGKLNHRGPYYETLKTILRVDQELKGLVVRKKGFAKVAGYGGTEEYERDHVPKCEFLQKLSDRGLDVFTFIERSWSRKVTPDAGWLKAEDNIALLQVNTYAEWWNGISKKTRNMVRKAEKSGVKTDLVESNPKFAEGVWKIYNETPIRQGRAFSHYGQPLENVRSYFQRAKSHKYVSAVFEGKLVGFVELVYGDNIAILSQILSLQSHWDKGVNNALVAKAVEVCAAQQIQWIMYGRMGNHPSLDCFKESNGFTKFVLTRYYVPLTQKGRVATRLGLHRQLKDILPQSLKEPLFPLFSWVSRTKMRFRLKIHPIHAS
jgi:hypothetical protein